MESREEILLENYSKVINIEALTLVDMLNKQILPATLSFMKELSDTINSKAACGVATCDMEKDLLTKVSTLSNNLYAATNKLSETIDGAAEKDDVLENAQYYKDAVLPSMAEARKYSDELEGLVGKKYWPIPTYSDLLFYQQ